MKDAAKDTETECIFCVKPAEDDDEKNLIVHRGERCFVILNLYPYTNGHLMIAPYEHLPTLPELDAELIAMGMDQAYCGSPAEATAEEGEQTFEVLAEMLVEQIREVAA